jgi:L-lactate dehydrogenase complex protein LldF
MKPTSNDFIPLAQVAMSNSELRAAVGRGTLNATRKREAALLRNGREHGEALREQAAVSRRQALARLPELLLEAEQKMRENGIEVLWARDADEANAHVLRIASDHQVRRVVKAKSMVSEELGLNHALEDAGLNVVETDLGEFILQLGNEAPSHIVTPIIHKPKSAVRDLFVTELDMPPTDDAEEMTRFARQVLRQEFLAAEMGISGGNFIIAETGSLCMVTNEGNGRLSTTVPGVHVAVVGIEKVVATLEDYVLLTQLLPRSATGQLMTCYMQMINGPRRADEPDGPDHVYVILIDNGRSAISASKYSEALACIRCGACLNACPVYRVTGGHAYGWVYPGPIGAVITPLLTGHENATPLPQASSLCGACYEVCPVKIDLPRMLLDLRHEQVMAGTPSPIWGWGIRLWRHVSESRRLFSLAGRLLAFLGPLLPRQLPPPLGGWTRHRSSPRFAERSFRARWVEIENKRNPRL